MKQPDYSPRAARQLAKRAKAIKEHKRLYAEALKMLGANSEPNQTKPPQCHCGAHIINGEACQNGHLAFPDIDATP